MPETLASTFWIAQLIGIVGLIFTVVAFQGKTRKQILRGQLIGAVFFAVHFFLLAAYVGALVNLIVILRTIIFERTKHSIFWLVLFIGVLLCVLAFTSKGWITAFPVLGTIIGTYALWQDKPAAIRFFFVLSSLVWIPYTILVQSYAGLVNQIIVSAALLIGIYSLDADWVHKHMKRVNLIPWFKNLTRSN
jgi:hypothetical protein